MSSSSSSFSSSSCSSRAAAAAAAAKREHQKKPKFYINDHPDILIEVLRRLDDRWLSVAACVCRMWCSISRNESLWENLCFSHVSPPPSDVRPVVLALGGYRRLYMVCLRPVLRRLSLDDFSSSATAGNNNESRVWTRDEVQLSLSLFSIDYYERLGLQQQQQQGNGNGNGNGNGRLGEASSLMFLCKPVNVS